MITIIEIIAVILGVIQSILVLLNLRSNWIFYVLQMVFLALFSYNVGLYGNVALNCLYMFFGFWGCATWGKDNSLPTMFVKKELPMIGALVFLATAATTLLVLSLPGEFKAFDIATVTTSIIATVLMVKHKVEAWVVWFINDILYIITYFQLPDQPIYLIIMYIFWTGMAVGSFFTWKKSATGVWESIYKSKNKDKYYLQEIVRPIYRKKTSKK